jgi:hypothetical protein
LVDSFFLAYENKEDSSDDDMDYGTEKKKETQKEKVTTVKNGKNDGYFEDVDSRGNPTRKVFEFEIFWNKDRQQAAVHKLDRCKKHEKFAEISETADKSNSEDITLEQCFNSFMTSEMLGSDNAWY